MKTKVKLTHNKSKYKIGKMQEILEPKNIILRDLNSYGAQQSQLLIQWIMNLYWINPVG